MKAVLFGCWMWRYGGYGGGILNMIQACALACACQHDHDFQNAIKLIVQRQCFEFSGIKSASKSCHNLDPFRVNFWMSDLDAVLEYHGYEGFAVKEFGEEGTEGNV